MFPTPIPTRRQPADRMPFASVSRAELDAIADALSEAAVEIENLAGPGNVVAERCRRQLRVVESQEAR